MRKQKEARPGAPTPERAERVKDRADLHTRQQCNTETRNRQAGISLLLSVGSANAIPIAHLKALTGLDSRTIRAMIQRERLDGVPICSNNSTGYYLPESERERMECARSMYHRAGEIMRVAKAIREATE